MAQKLSADNLNVANETARISSLAKGDISRPTFAEVDLRQLTKNLRAIDAATGTTKVMPVLKANAYGHGIVPVAEHLEAFGAAYFGVALLEEGLLVREAGIRTPILVLGGIVPEQIPHYLQNDLTLTAHSIEKLDHINSAAASLGVRARVHLEVDTGMERVGVHWYNADNFFEHALSLDHCEIEGVYSHFANSDSADLSSARSQYDRFMEALSYFEKHDLPMPIRHLANSGGILQLPESHLDMVRAGIMLYGIYPSPECQRTIPVAPVLSLKSKVVFFKVVEPKMPVSYGHTWESDHRIRVVTIPIGYGDGYSRGLSNQGQVLIRGRRYPIIGRVCMDQIMVNIEWDEAYNGDSVTLLGGDGSESISADDLALWLDTIPYEILTSVNTRVPRKYIHSWGPAMTNGSTGRLERNNGLYEKVLLDTLLKHEIAQCNRYGNPLAVLMLTICGTPPEDEDLREKATTMIVHVINSNLRSSDMPGHYDEDFLILMPYTDAEGAISVGERLLAQISELLDTPSLADITVCVGLAVHGGGKSIEPPDLIKQAQEATEKSRTEGAGNVVLYGT